MTHYNAHKARLNRLLGPDGRCLDVAIDHGVFNEYTFLDGLEDMTAVVLALANAQPDAIQMNYGQADLLQNLPGRNKPSLVLRVDFGNCYNTVAHNVMFDRLVHEEEPIISAIRMDAACVVCNLLLLPGEPDLHRQSLLNCGRLRNICDRYGMPLMIEPLVMKAGDERGGYQVDGNKKLIVALVRQAREIGADVIKADPTEHTEDYHEVITAARCPVLVRGGGKKPVELIFKEACAVLQQGASGLVYGRNIYQHPNRVKIVKALMAMIHEEADEVRALSIYEGE